MRSPASADGSFALHPTDKKMKRNVLIFGLILGTILCINMVYTVQLCYTNPDFKGNDVVGYAAMVVVFSLTFVGIRNYRNKQLNGEISFGKAFKTGALIAVVGSTLYVIVWLFYYYLFVPDFLDKFIPHALNDVAPADLPAKTQEMEQLREMYKNPFFIVLITYFEVLPVGLIVALVSSFILRTKKKQ
jgi:hypothetical protein